MKNKVLKQLVVAMILVPVMVVFVACGGSKDIKMMEGVYKIQTVGVTIDGATYTVDEMDTPEFFGLIKKQY